MLYSVLTKKEIVGLGSVAMTDYYLEVCEN